MRTAICISTVTLLTALFACKKDEDSTPKSFYYGKWDVRERQYNIIDTSYTEQIPAGEQTYEFAKSGSVKILNPNTVYSADTWEVNGQNDSLIFGNAPGWKILEKSPNNFRVKFYQDSNTLLEYRLEK